MDIHVITLRWLGYTWYIYVIDCVNIPEGRWAFDPLWCNRRHGFKSSRSRRTAPVPPCRSAWKADRSGEVKLEIWKVYSAKYKYGIFVGYTHWQTEGHLLPAIPYLVQKVFEFLSRRPHWNSDLATKSTLACKSLCLFWTLQVWSDQTDAPDINV